jgi:hypothetical protein
MFFIVNVHRGERGEVRNLIANIEQGITNVEGQENI